MQKRGVHSSPDKVPGDDRPRGSKGLAAIEPPTSEFLQRVKSRDPETLEQFFDLYFSKIFGLVQRMLGDRDAAEDVTQDIFFKIHQAIDRIDPERDPLPWLTVIACNTCRKYWRSKAYNAGKKGVSFEDTPGLSDRLPDPSLGPAANLSSKQNEQQIREAIDSLPIDLRESVILHAYEGLSHDQIATSMGLSHAAARKRYSRALAELGKQLKDVLDKEGLTEIPSVNEPFDPAHHEAIRQVLSNEHPSDTVVEEHRKGYKLKGKLIRAAMVAVSKREEKASS